SSSAVHALQRLLRLLCAETRRISDQHVREPDDGVERRAQLMAHARDELRLVLARLRQLAALFLDLAEQARVLDGQHRLRRERLQEINGTLGKVARLLAPDHERPDDTICADQRHDEARPKSGPHCDLSHRAWRLVANIRDLQWLSVLDRLAESIGSTGWLASNCCTQLITQAIRCPHLQCLVLLIKDIDDTSIRL